MTNIFEKQPDYETWPEGELFEKKGAWLDEIENRHTAGNLTEGDFQYLIHKATNFYQLLDFAAKLRIEFEVELLTKNLEIEELKRQLEDKDA